MEGDSRVITDALRTTEPVLAGLGLACLLRTREFLKVIFIELSYSHVRRDGIKVAHCLAKLAANFPNCVVWIHH